MSNREQDERSGATPVPAILTWQERSNMREFIQPKDAVPHMLAEIADLRAALVDKTVPAILTDERIIELAVKNGLKVRTGKGVIIFARALEAELAAVIPPASDVPGKGQAVAYADPAAFANFKAGTATNEWMWAKPDAGLVPLYTHPSPVSMPVAAAGVAYQIKQHGWASMWMDASKAEYDACDTEKRCFPAAPVAVDRNAVDAARYRWLRDKSEPGICAFYLSVGKAFDGVKFTQSTVDEAIDAQIVAPLQQSADKPAEGEK
jgi:hypothetical protein